MSTRYPDRYQLDVYADNILQVVTDYNTELCSAYFCICILFIAYVQHVLIALLLQCYIRYNCNNLQYSHSRLSYCIAIIIIIIIIISFSS
jgi:glucan phosphoethanolaminetransferase (alkaline phosphatase superfamily)